FLRRDLRVAEREARAGHGELGKPVEPARALGIEMVLRAEVGDFGGDAAAKRRWVEAGDRPDRRCAGFETGPQAVRRRADRRDRADAGDHDPAHVASAAALIPASVRDAMPWMNTGPITRLAASRPMRGQRGPSQVCTISASTAPPPLSSIRRHTPSMPRVIPLTWRYRISPAASST